MMTILNYIKKSPHRNRLERYLRRVLPLLEGPILDIGSGNRRYDYLMKETPTAIDTIENKEKKVLYGNATKLSFPGDSFQSVVCIEVLEYIDKPQEALDEMYRVMKKGGVLVLSVPFLFRVHGDRFRFTPLQLRDMFFRFEIVSFNTVGGWYTTILTIVWNKIKRITFAPFRYFLLLVITPLLFCTRKRSIEDEQYASGYIVVAKKKI